MGMEAKHGEKLGHTQLGNRVPQERCATAAANSAAPSCTWKTAHTHTPPPAYTAHRSVASIQVYTCTSSLGSSPRRANASSWWCAPRRGNTRSSSGQTWRSGLSTGE